MTMEEATRFADRVLDRLVHYPKVYTRYRRYDVELLARELVNITRPNKNS